MTGSATAENPRVIPDAMVPRFAAAPTASCWKVEQTSVSVCRMSHFETRANESYQEID
jgi:hypothetical protein